MTQSLQLAQATNVQTSALIAHLPTKNCVQTGLLGLSVVTSIFSVIPPFRLAGSLATRSIALLSNTLECIKNPNTKQHWTDRLTNYYKVAIVAIGIAGLAAASPALLVASLAADLGLEAIKSIEASYQKDYSKAVFHFTMSVIDALVLGAVLSGSWVVIVTAASVNVLVMGCLAVNSACRAIENDGNAIETISYFALFLLGFATAITSAKITSTVKTNSTFNVDNKGSETLSFFDKNGKLVASVKPGESASFEVPYKDTLRHLSFAAIPSGNGGPGSVVPVQKGSYLNGLTLSQNGESLKSTKWDAVHVATKTVVSKEPLAVEHFTKLPLGGNATTTPEMEQ